MTTVSTRLDEQTKNEAEAIANQLGIHLSTAINVFLRQFVAHKGFPFPVMLPTPSRSTVIDVKQLDAAVKKAVSDSGASTSHPSVFVAPTVNESNAKYSEG